MQTHTWFCFCCLGHFQFSVFPRYCVSMMSGLWFASALVKNEKEMRGKKKDWICVGFQTCMVSHVKGHEIWSVKGFGYYQAVLSRKHFKTKCVKGLVLTSKQIHFSLIVAVWVFLPFLNVKPALRGPNERGWKRKHPPPPPHYHKPSNASSWSTDVRSFVRGNKNFHGRHPFVKFKLIAQFFHFPKVKDWSGLNYI